MINVNKLFPRLSIRVKLAIAFAIVALGPLAVISVIGTRETVFQIQSKASDTLEHDLEMAEAQTARSLAAAENHVELVAQVVLGPLLGSGRVSNRALVEAAWVVQSLLATEKSLYQVKLIDASGRYRMIVRASGPAYSEPDAEGGEYYAWRGSTLRPHTQLLFAVEVRSEERRVGKEC